MRITERMGSKISKTLIIIITLIFSTIIVSWVLPNQLIQDERDVVLLISLLIVVALLGLFFLSNRSIKRKEQDSILEEEYLDEQSSIVEGKAISRINKKEVEGILYLTPDLLEFRYGGINSLKISLSEIINVEYLVRKSFVKKGIKIVCGNSKEYEFLIDYPEDWRSLVKHSAFTDSIDQV